MTPHQSSGPARSRARKARESSTRGREGVGWKTAGLLAAGLAALSLVGSADARWVPDYQDYQDWVPSSIAGVGEKVSSVGAQGLATLSDATARAKSSIFDSFDSWSAPPIADIDDTAASPWLDRHSSATEQAAELVKSWTTPPASDVCAKASSMLDQLSTVREQSGSSFHSWVTSPVADIVTAVSSAADQTTSNIKSWSDSQIANVGTKMSALKVGLKSTTAHATSSFQSITAPFIANACAKASSAADGLFATVKAALEPSPPPSKLTLEGLGEFIGANFEADRYKMEAYTDVVPGQEQHFLFKQRSIVDRSTEWMRLCQINPTDANTDGDKTVRVPNYNRPKQIAGPPSVAKTKQSVPSWTSAITSLWRSKEPRLEEPTQPLVRCTDAQSFTSGLGNRYWKGRFLGDGENSVKYSSPAEFGPYTTNLRSAPRLRS